MAPEISPEQKIYDSKVDMYSFGLMMWEMWFGEIVPSKPFCRSQDEVTRQIEVKKQELKGRRYSPPAKWIELMVSLWESDPCVRKTAMESQVLIKEIKLFVKESEWFKTDKRILVNVYFLMFTLPVVKTIFLSFWCHIHLGWGQMQQYLQQIHGIFLIDFLVELANWNCNVYKSLRALGV